MEDGLYFVYCNKKLPVDLCNIDREIAWNYTVEMGQQGYSTDLFNQGQWVRAKGQIRSIEKDIQFRCIPTLLSKP